MKKSLLRITAIFSCIIIGFVIGLSGYYYILSRNSEPVKKNESSIPYSYVPDSVGLMFSFDSDDVFVYLDFENEKISVLFPQSTLESYEYCYGYKINYRVSSDISLLAGIIDLVDGIEIPIENEKLRYTGVQIADLVSTTVEKQVLKREITTALFDKISEVGLQKSDFVYIIENSETDLTVPQCYYWDEKIREMAQNTVILN